MRNKRKLATVAKETQEEHPLNGQSQIPSVPRTNKDYITQVSEETRSRVITKPSQDFSRTVSHILGALSKLDEFLLNPEIRTHFGTVPGRFWNTNVENQDPKEDGSQDDPHLKVGPFVYQSRHSNDSDPDEAPHMVTGVQEEIPYCSPGISSGKQKKAPSTSQPQFCIESTPATIEADQIFLALQQLATNSSSANSNKNINRISKFPESLTTTMPTSDAKSEKLEMFEDLFQTSLKTRNQHTEEDKINYFYSRMRSDALQTFKDITSPNKENWEIF